MRRSACTVRLCDTPITSSEITILEILEACVVVAAVLSQYKRYPRSAEVDSSKWISVRKDWEESMYSLSISYAPVERQDTTNVCCSVPFWWTPLVFPTQGTLQTNLCFLCWLLHTSWMLPPAGWASFCTSERCTLRQGQGMTKG